MTTLKVKSGAGGTWEEVGGIGLGVPAGGTTGQVLTKTSAADYATAWASTPPVLANNAFLRGYKADGTTAQNLIGMTAADEVSIAPSLAAGKQVYVPRLTVQGTLLLGTDQSVNSADGGQVIYPGAVAIGFAINRDVYFNYTSGNATFYRNVSVTGVLDKGGVPYTHPDHILESWATGRIEKFLEAPGARDYEGLRPLADVEASIREHWRLPRHIRDGTYDVFRRGDELLASLEEAYLYLIDHAHRLKALEDTVRRAEP